MSNFFNGAENTEAASLNLSTSNLNIIVKQALSNVEMVDELTEILNSDDPEFDKDVRLVSTFMGKCDSAQEYSMHDVRSALSRRLNTMSRAISKNHGFGNYLRYSKGKVNKAELQITDQS